MAIGSGGTWQRKAVDRKDVMLNQFFVLAATWNTDGYLSGQITVIPKPELRGFWGHSVTITTIWGDHSQAAEIGRDEICPESIFITMLISIG